MERKDYAIIILVIALVGCVSFSSAYMLSSQPWNVNKSTNNSNVSNDNNTTTNQTPVQSQSEPKYISKKQAINTVKKAFQTKDLKNITFNAVLVTTEGDPYYLVSADGKIEGYPLDYTVKVDAESGEPIGNICPY
jgi:Zn-dependent metalloprotease